MFILGLTLELRLSDANKNIVIPLYAKHCMAIAWKNTEVPTVEHWIKRFPFG